LYRSLFIIALPDTLPERLSALGPKGDRLAAWATKDQLSGQLMPLRNTSASLKRGVC
jgi:hypothetical protein